MTPLLLKSYKLKYENTNDINLQQLAAELNVTMEELFSLANEYKMPITEWRVKDDDYLLVYGEGKASETNIVNTPQVYIDKAPSSTNNTQLLVEEDKLKENIDEAYNKIIIQVHQSLIGNDYDSLSTKELKDLATIVKIVEDAKYPKNTQTQIGFEVDLQDGVVKFLAQTKSDL